MRGWLAWIAAATLFVAGFYLVAFGLYGWRIMHSERMAALRDEAGGYGCIGALFDPARPRWRAEPMLARFYLDDGKSQAPNLSWAFRYRFTTSAIDLATSAEQANRLIAAMPNRGFDGYDGIALHYAGKPFCSLPAGQRQAIRQFHGGGFRGGRAQMEAAMRGEAAAAGKSRSAPPPRK